MKSILNSIKKMTSLVALFALVFSSFSFSLGLNTAYATDFVTINVVKYIDGQMATPTTANNADFQVHSTWTSNGVDDFGDITLDEDGFNGDSTPYSASANLAMGTTLNMNETIDGTVTGNNCDANAEYSLVGYTSGDTMAEAQAGTPTTATLTLTNMITNKFIIIWNHDCDQTPPPTSAKITVLKYIDGQMATAVNANNTDFTINADYNVNGTSGSTQLTLSETNATAYQAVSADLPFGSYYNTSEVIDGTITGDNCDANAQYSLVGYTSGNTLAEAQAGTPSLTVPSFGFISSDKYVIVWNHDCDEPAPTTATVTIVKYVDGQMATGVNAGNTDFQVNSNYTINGNNSTEVFTLDENGANPYTVTTSPLPMGSGYSTTEVIDGTITGANCDANASYSFVGYTYGNTLAEAQAGTPSTTTPTFASLSSDKYVIVWNHDCSDTSGTIGGNVGNEGVLAVTSIEVLDDSATADGTFGNGWKYAFNVTVPTDETHVSMKFSDWAQTGGSGTIAVANNMRISSAQADNSNATVSLTAANTFSSPTLNMTGDLDPVMPGKQVKIIVEVSIPQNSINGSYTTNYTVKSE